MLESCLSVGVIGSPYIAGGVVACRVILRCEIVPTVSILFSICLLRMHGLVSLTAQPF